MFVEEKKRKQKTELEHSTQKTEFIAQECITSVSN